MILSVLFYTKCKVEGDKAGEWVKMKFLFMEHDRLGKTEELDTVKDLGGPLL